MSSTEAEFRSLWRKRRKALRAGVIDLRKRCAAAGLLGQRWDFLDQSDTQHTLGEALDTFVGYPELMTSAAMFRAHITLLRVARFWAPDRLAERRNEQRLGRMYLDLRGTRTLGQQFPDIS